MVSHIVRTRLLPIMMIFVCCLLPNLLNAINGNLAHYSGIFAFFFGIMFVWYVYLIVHCSIKLKRIRDREKQ